MIQKNQNYVFFFLFVIVHKRNLHQFFSSFLLFLILLNKVKSQFHMKWTIMIIYARVNFTIYESPRGSQCLHTCHVFVRRADYSLTGAWGTTLDSPLEPNTPRSVTPRTRHLPHRPLYLKGWPVSYGLQLQHFTPFRLISGKCWIFLPLVG